MKLHHIGLIAALAAGSQATAQSDAEKGEKEFKKCVSCHAVAAADGTVIVKGGKTGPNLFGVIGRPVASVADFKYGDSILALGATGAVWDEAGLVEYLTDPGAYLKAKLSDDAAKTKMTFKLAKGGEDVVAYLAQLAAGGEEGEGEEAREDAGG